MWTFLSLETTLRLTPSGNIVKAIYSVNVKIHCHSTRKTTRKSRVSVPYPGDLCRTLVAMTTDDTCAQFATQNLRNQRCYGVGVRARRTIPRARGVSNDVGGEWAGLGVPHDAATIMSAVATSRFGNIWDGKHTVAYEGGRWSRRVQWDEGSA